jgi:5-carboxymethyl-2-hydroxymuconate isomerase
LPHLIYEYTDNLTCSSVDIPAQLKKSTQVLINLDGLFPTGAIRVRALRLAEYCIAEGTHDDAFVHATLRMGAGRSVEDKKRIGDELFKMICEHFAEVFQTRNLALSLDIQESSETGSWKKNNILARYKAA